MPNSCAVLRYECKKEKKTADANNLNDLSIMSLVSLCPEPSFHSDLFIDFAQARYL